MRLSVTLLILVPSVGAESKAKKADYSVPCLAIAANIYMMVALKLPADPSLRLFRFSSKRRSFYLHCSLSRAIS
jgi:hypothetical protein